MLGGDTRARNETIGECARFPLCPRGDAGPEVPKSTCCNNTCDSEVMSWAHLPHTQQVGPGHHLAVPQTVFLAAHLTGAENIHGGAFRYSLRGSATNITARIRSWLDTSPGLCFCLADRTCSVQIFHDDVRWTKQKTQAMEADVAELRSSAWRHATQRRSRSYRAG